MLANNNWRGGQGLYLISAAVAVDDTEDNTRKVFTAMISIHRREAELRGFKLPFKRAIPWCIDEVPSDRHLALARDSVHVSIVIENIESRS